MIKPEITTKEMIALLTSMHQHQEAPLTPLGEEHFKATTARLAAHDALKTKVETLKKGLAAAMELYYPESEYLAKVERYTKLESEFYTMKARVEKAEAKLAALRGDEPIQIVFDGPPEHVAGRFVEVEQGGKGINFGEWKHRDDGYWVLEFPNVAGLMAELEQARPLLEAAMRVDKELAIKTLNRLYHPMFQEKGRPVSVPIFDSLMPLLEAIPDGYRAAKMTKTETEERR